MTSLIKEIISVPQRFSISEQAEQQRNELVLAAQKVTAIVDQNSQILAANCARSIRRWMKQVEAMRVELTKHFLEPQRLLKALADDHVGPLEIELQRLERMATNFQEQEARRVKLEQEKQRKEFERLEAIRIEAEQRARAEAERVRVENEAAEAKAKAAEANVQTEAELDLAIQAEELRKENESLRLAEAEAEAELAAAAAKAVQNQLRQPLPEAIKARGQSMRKVMRWEVTDLEAFVKDRPDLCNIEPKPSAIAAMCVPEMKNLPAGLKLWWENKSTFSSR